LFDAAVLALALVLDALLSSSLLLLESLESPQMSAASKSSLIVLCV
jgi:hypothetical protein